MEYKFCWSEHSARRNALQKIMEFPGVIEAQFLVENLGSGVMEKSIDLQAGVQDVGSRWVKRCGILESFRSSFFVAIYQHCVVERKRTSADGGHLVGHHGVLKMCKFHNFMNNFRYVEYRWMRRRCGCFHGLFEVVLKRRKQNTRSLHYG